jgi:hypothetical protein
VDSRIESFCPKSAHQRMCMADTGVRPFALADGWPGLSRSWRTWMGILTLTGGGPRKPDFGLRGGVRPLYFFPVRFLPAIITLRKIRLIRV